MALRPTRAPIVRLTIAILVLLSTIAPGVCATLCASRLCCLSPVKAGTQVKRCPHCAAKASDKTHGIAAAKSGSDCCAWIGKKIDPPATQIPVHLQVAGAAPAILPSRPELTPAPVAVSAPILSSEDDRGPPGPPGRSSESRAPPTR